MIFSSGVTVGSHKQPDADYAKRQRQDHAHGEISREISELPVGLSRKFDNDPRQPITQREDARGAARMGQCLEAMGGDADSEKQHEAFERRLIKLARMARQK